MSGYIIDGGQKLTLDEFLVYQEERYEAAEARCKELTEALKEALDAGETLALHTHGRSENREIAEAKERLERAKSPLEKGPTE